MLFHLYQLTRNWPGFNHFAHWLVRELEVPLIRFVLRSFGPVNVVVRNSLRDPRHFNVFMSDIDVTVVGEEADFGALHRAAIALRSFLPNLGELEFYTPSEWDQQLALEAHVAWPYWQKVYLLRKLNWQRLKLARAETQYEKLKQARGIGITFEKLGQGNTPLNGEDLFPDLVLAADEEIPVRAHYSHFLEHQLSLGEATDGIRFSSPAAFRRLLLILPENDFYCDDAGVTAIKWLIMKREFLQTVTSIRLKTMKGEADRLSQDRTWLRVLHRRIRYIEDAHGLRR